MRYGAEQGCMLRDQKTVPAAYPSTPLLKHFLGRFAHSRDMPHGTLPNTASTTCSKPFIACFARSKDMPPPRFFPHPSPMTPSIPPKPPLTAMSIPKLPISTLFGTLHGLICIKDGSQRP